MFPTSFNFHLDRIFGVILFLVLGIFSNRCVAQCDNFDYYYYQSSPAGAVCNPQNVTVSAVYIGNDYGEMRWYSGSGTLLHTNYVSSSSTTSNYSFYASATTTVYVTFYSSTYDCEGLRDPLVIYMESPLVPVIQYARECGDGVAHIQVNNAGVATHYLYKRNVANTAYDLVQSNSTGLFDITSFNALDKNKYAIRVTAATGCANSTYYPVSIDISGGAIPVPTVTGNLSTCAGTTSTLTASALTQSYKWYKMPENTLLYQGASYTVSSALSAGSYTYHVRSLSGIGCESAPTEVLFTVNPRAQEGSISASQTTIHLGEEVTISTSGGVGSPYYWCSTDGGTTWNVFAQSYGGQFSFQHRPTAVGTYRYHFRNQTACGFCFDNGGTCTTFPTVDVTVIPGLLFGGNIVYSGGAINYNTSPTAFSVTPALYGSCGSYAYQWEVAVGSIAAGFNPISGATSANYSPGELLSTHFFRRKATCGSETAYSNVVEVGVYPLLSGGIILPASQSVHFHEIASAFVLSNVAGGDGSYTYQWQYATTAAFDVPFDITGATGLSYTPPEVLQTLYYRVRVTSHGVTKNSASAAMIVYPELLPGRISPESYTIVSGGSPGIIAASAASGGNCSGSYTYQWQASWDGGYYSDIAGAVSMTYEPMNITVPTWFRRKVTCDERTSFTSPSFINIGTPSNSNRNYIISRSFLRNGVMDESAALSVTSQQEMVKSTQYFDGLGRLEQTVLQNASSSSSGFKDIVTPNLYDAFGRETRTYLPYVSPGNDGVYKLNPLSELSNFYKTYTPEESFYYADKEYEHSPLSTVTKKFAQGDSWNGGNRGIGQKQLINTEIDAVRQWTITDNLPSFGTYYSGNAYDANRLLKNIHIDEQGQQIIEFKDNAGQVVLKKVQVNASVLDGGDGSPHVGWLCTYYIYDDINQLRAVVQPEGVRLLEENNWDISALDGVILKEQCFLYEYDSRGRIIMKRVPGADPVYMVYDALDRMVFTQDANMRVQGQWLATCYDALNRPVLTGLMSSSDDRQTLQETVTTQTTFAAGSGPHHTVVQGITVSRTPLMAVATFEVLTNQFYNDYAWRSNFGNPLSATRNTNYDSYLLSPSNTFPYPQNATIQNNNLKGMLTGSRTRILGTSDFLVTVNFYDSKGRIIQMQSTNNTGVIDITNMQYSWSGQPLLSVEKQGYGNPETSSLLTLTKTTYDDLWRVGKIEKRVANSEINGGALPTEWCVISENSYDALGQLKEKKLGRKKDIAGSYTSEPLETIGYDYNIRGWVLGANRSYLKDESASGYAGHYFGFELGYDKNTITPGSRLFNQQRYDGNITGTLWKSKGDGARRIYDFEYDIAKRFGQARFNQNTNPGSGGTWNTDEANFSVHGLEADNGYMMKYDGNGNILGMAQHGIVPGNSNLMIDALHYHYVPNTNKLQMVSDDSNDKNSRLGDFKYDPATKTSTDYGYDKNGNLITDLNKGINGSTGIDLISGGAIVYNYLNLPTSITIAGKGTISYVYDASGRKLKKIVTDNTQPTPKVTTTLYIGSAVYENEVLQFVGQEEGRIRFTPALGASSARLDFDYFLKDHLGNVRMVLTDEQETSVYPVATLEGSLSSDGTPNAAYIEKNYYAIDAANVVDKPLGIPDYVNNNGAPPYNNNPNSATTAISEKMYRLQATSGGAAIGLGTTIRVMSGDKVDIFGKSFYQVDNTNESNYSLPVLNLLSGFLGGPSGIGAAKGVTAAGLNGIGTLATAVGNYLGHPDRGAGARPKAYINYILLDDQFRYVSGSFSRVGSIDVIKNHYEDLHDIAVTKNGYLYVYCSNESPVQVFFDNLQVIHTKGPLLEETHYYPFGLTMAGISSKALGNIENKYKYSGNELQSKEFSDGSGLETYDFNARTYDPQIGRFIQKDPLSFLSFNQSPYTFTSNNPISRMDPGGLKDTVVNGEHGSTSAPYAPVVVTPANNRNQDFHWFGWSSSTNYNRSSSQNTYNSRREQGLSPLQPGDRSWYKQDVHDYDLEHGYQNWVMARDFEAQFYTIYFSALAAPFVIEGIVAAAPIGSGLYSSATTAYTNAGINIYTFSNIALNREKAYIISAIGTATGKYLSPAAQEKLEKASQKFSNFLNPSTLKALNTHAGNAKKIIQNFMN